MKIHNSINGIEPIKELVLTIGTFDGVHLGHQKLINSINQKAKQVGGESGLLTFHPHPRMVIRKSNEENILLLTPMKERIERLSKTDLDHLFIVAFSIDFANQTPQEYVKEILLRKLGAKHLVIGYDHRFGKNRNGNVDLLNSMSEEFDFTVEQINRQQVDEITYSSTTIRNFLKDGHVKQVNQLLGYNYSLRGVVVHGDKRGRKLGYPTANIRIKYEEKLIPKNGVYAAKAMYKNKWHNSMLNIGTRPTFAGLGEKTIETVLFDFNKDLYGRELQIELVQKIREEQKFNNAEELKTQLQHDELSARSILNSI